MDGGGLMSYKLLSQEEDVRIKESYSEGKLRYFDGVSFPNEITFQLVVEDKSTRRKKNVSLELFVGDDILKSSFAEVGDVIGISTDFKENDFNTKLLNKIRGVTGINFPTLNNVRSMIR